MANPVLSEIRRLRDEKQNGILSLMNQSGERVGLFIREGTIEAASSNLKTHRLGEYLKKDAAVQLNDLDRLASEAQRQKILLGEAVIRLSLITLPQESVSPTCCLYPAAAKRSLSNLNRRCGWSYLMVSTFRSFPGTRKSCVFSRSYSSPTRFKGC